MFYKAVPTQNVTNPVSSVTPTSDLISRGFVQRCLRRTAPTGLAESSIHSILATLVYDLCDLDNVKFRVFPGEFPTSSLCLWPPKFRPPSPSSSSTSEKAYFPPNLTLLIALLLFVYDYNECCFVTRSLFCFRWVFGLQRGSCFHVSSLCLLFVIRGE